MITYEMLISLQNLGLQLHLAPVLVSLIDANVAIELGLSNFRPVI